LIAIPRVNPSLHKQITIFKNRLIQKIIGYSGTILLIFFFVIHTYKDISMSTKRWYFHSTYIWLIVMSIATFFFIYRWKSLTLKNKNLSEVFKKLPDQ
jgi:NADH:ubiquinone oxidoreductase subunit 6 (subunit J)